VQERHFALEAMVGEDVGNVETTTRGGTVRPCRNTISLWREPKEHIWICLNIRNWNILFQSKSTCWKNVNFAL